MKIIWLIFRNDLKRLTVNAASVLIVLGLALLPSAFAWLNILACWDVFSNTGNLKVAVASNDKGYQNELMPLKVNMGDQVLSALRANDQLKWTFVTEDEAIEGTKSGEFYAAVIIPEDFSEEMLTFYQTNATPAQIDYYINEKKNGIAPKITGEGADRVSYQINEVFSQTVTEIALGSALSLYNYSNEAHLNTYAESTVSSINSAANQLTQAAQILRLYSSIYSATQTTMQSDYNTAIKPLLDNLQQTAAQELPQNETTEKVLSQATSIIANLTQLTQDTQTHATTMQNEVDCTANNLEESAEKLSSVSAAVSNALELKESSTLQTILSEDPETLAATLAAPIQIDRHAMYSANSFGSQMAPLYATLALWIGGILLVITLKATVSQRARDDLPKQPTLNQMFIGRFGVFALMSTAQSITLALGNLFLIGVQANHPWLYVLCLWVTGMVFTFIMYTLVVSFANLGKAFAVLMLIMQVTTANGSYPLPLLPAAFQTLSPFMPATHAISAMRAAMMGIYQNDFWLSLGTLTLYILPCLAIGLALRKPFIRLINWYVSKVEESKLMA